MVHRAVDRFLERQRWLEPLADFLQKIAAAIYKGTAGHALKSFLNGTWLGHPLHPVITDVPVGAWTLAILFDLIHLANRGSAVWIDGATLLVGVGVLAALGAWVTGYTDWSDTYDRERRFGIAHALLMSTALVLYIVSFFLRLPLRHADRSGQGGTGYHRAGPLRDESPGRSSRGPACPGLAPAELT